MTRQDVDKLQQRYLGHLLGGEKSVRFYELEDQHLDMLRNKILAAPCEKSALTTAFPFPISRSALRGIKLQKPVLVGKEEDETYHYAIFCSVRYMEERVKLEGVQLGDGLDFDSVIGIRTVQAQAFEVVAIPKAGNSVSVRVDLPVGFPADLANGAHVNTRDDLNRRLGSVVFAEPTNLYPLLDKLYTAKQEGIVVELGFMTDGTASKKDEKMRRQHTCLRSEKYHKGGMDAIGGKIDPYKMALNWPLKDSLGKIYYPELMLNGSSKSPFELVPQIASAEIRRCATLDDFEFVVDLVEKYLGDEPQDGD